MKIEELIEKTPEMTEEKLLKNISNNLILLNLKEWSRNRYNAQEVLDEWDLIQQKKSKLSKSQRDQICTLVSISLVDMVKNE